MDLAHAARQPVACLAADSLVPATGAFLDDVAVAIGADYPARVDDGPRGVVRDRSRAVVAVLTEVRGNEEGSCEKKEQDAPGEKTRDPEEVLCIFE
jgi:hypothetical protein